MATTLTPEDIQTIAKQVYQMIITGQANSISYTQSVEAPTDPEEQQLWVVPAIKNPDDKQSRVAGNMGLRNILEAFGNEALEQNTIAVQNIEAMSVLKTNAENAAEAAEADRKKAEAYAIGKMDGVPVDDTDPAYHNNASYYAALTSDDRSHVDGVKQHVDTVKSEIDQTKQSIDSTALEVSSDKDAASASASQAAQSETGAETARSDAATLKSQMEALLQQASQVVQKQVVAPITIEGVLMGQSVEISGGQPYLVISEIETVEDDTGGETA